MILEIKQCAICKHLFEPFLHYVEYEGKNLCETCFFNIAVDKLKAIPRQLDSIGRPIEPDEDIDYETYYNID